MLFYYLCTVGEQKFRVDCDSPHMVRIAELARDYKVPVILHFEHDLYNRHIERFHTMLEKFPTVLSNMKMGNGG